MQAFDGRELGIEIRASFLERHPLRAELPVQYRHRRQAANHDDSDRGQCPSRHALHARGANLCGCDLGEPHLFARQRLFLGTPLGVFTRLAGIEIGRADFAQTLAKIRARHKPLRGDQTLGTMVKPGFEPAVARPFARGSFDAFRNLQIGYVGFKPCRQRRPLAQETLVRHLDDVYSGAPVGNQKARAHEAFHNSGRAIRNFVHARNPAHRHAGVGIDPRQPRNEGGTQRGELRLLVERNRR